VIFSKSRSLHYVLKKQRKSILNDQDLTQKKEKNIKMKTTLGTSIIIAKRRRHQEATNRQTRNNGERNKKHDAERK
jgi:hypothetical protein